MLSKRYILKFTGFCFMSLCWANFRGLGKKVGKLGWESIKSLPLIKDEEMLEKVQEYCKVLSNQNFKLQGHIGT